MNSNSLPQSRTVRDSGGQVRFSPHSTCLEVRMHVPKAGENRLCRFRPMIVAFFGIFTADFGPTAMMRPFFYDHPPRLALQPLLSHRSKFRQPARGSRPGCRRFPSRCPRALPYYRRRLGQTKSPSAALIAIADRLENDRTPGIGRKFLQSRVAGPRQTIGLAPPDQAFNRVAAQSLAFPSTTMFSSPRGSILHHPTGKHGQFSRRPMSCPVAHHQHLHRGGRVPGDGEKTGAGAVVSVHLSRSRSRTFPAVLLTAWSMATERAVWPLISKGCGIRSCAR